MISIYESYPSSKIQSPQLLLSPPSPYTGSVTKFCDFYFSYIYPFLFLLPTNHVQKLIITYLDFCKIFLISWQQTFLHMALRKSSLKYTSEICIQNKMKHAYNSIKRQPPKIKPVI